MCYVCVLSSLIFHFLASDNKSIFLKIECSYLKFPFKANFPTPFRFSATLGQVLAKQNCTEITKNAIDVMSDNGRLNKVEGIISAFGQIMSAHRREVICEVTTAKVSQALHHISLKSVIH